MILAFDANAKLLNFTGKLKTASGIWSLSTVCVNAILKLSNVTKPLRDKGAD